MREIKAPLRPGLERRVFLAGSIEMGQAEQWQKRIVDALSGAGDLVILNPRRDDWDDSWPQRADDPQFSEQVNWELDMLDAADVVVMYLAPGTKSPVSLLELGLCALGRHHPPEFPQSPDRPRYVQAVERGAGRLAQRARGGRWDGAEARDRAARASPVPRGPRALVS